MDEKEQELYQIYVTNPDYVQFAVDLDFELNHSETYDCSNDPCRTCRFQNARACAVSQKVYPELYKALINYFLEHHPEKLI